MTNPVSAFSGFEFLLFFGLFVAITVGLCAAYVTAKDETRLLRPGPPPDIVDPYEVAYLRGGENELARVAIVSLAERGYLELQAEGRISQTECHPSPGDLSSAERTVYDWFTEARPVKNVFEGHLPGELSAYCLPLEEKLRQERLVSTDADSDARRMAGWVGGLVIAGLGGSRMLVGLARSEHIGFLVILAVVGIFMLAFVCSKERLSSLGRAHVRQLRDSAAKLSSANGARFALAAAIFGMSGLVNTPLSALGEEFKRGETSASGECGACGGGDGGGGCGGCGGCG